MHCPKCGTENTIDAEICNACGYVFGKDLTEKPVAKPKISRLAITAFVLSILSLLFFLLAAIPAIVLGIISLFKIKKSKGQLRGKGLAISGICIPIIFILIFYLWCIDAPPIPNDYTIADLRSAGPEYNRSYELLMSMSDEEEDLPDAPKIGLSVQDVNTIERFNKIFKEGNYSRITKLLKEKGDNIEQAWKNGQKGRDIITELNRFSEIADLTEPALDAEMNFLKNFRRLVHLYQAYIYLQTEQGNSKAAVNELVELDSVFRKLSVNARSIVMKLVCIAGLARGIMTANFIVNNPQTSQESLELLAEHFKPLTKEQTSLRNSIISEYLMFVKTLDTRQRGAYTLPKTPFLKRNSMSRLYKNYCDSWIASEENRQQSKELTVWPALYPKLPVAIDSDGNFPWYYKAYNPGGSLMIGILMPALDKVFEIRTRLQIHNDLFQIVLNKRLGREVSLKACAYSDEYIIDVEKERIFSPGPDGKIDTEDDIKLLINPDVLKWTN